MSNQPAITQRDDLLIQSYISCALISELVNNRFLDSDFFSQMTFGNSEMKKIIRAIGLDNQGFALMALYAMLVIPKSLITDKHPKEFKTIQDFLEVHCKNTSTSYSTDTNGIKFLRHIRNAVAHASVSFRPNDAVCFMDKDPKNASQSFSTELPLKYLGELVHKLQFIHLSHIQNIQPSAPQTTALGESGPRD